MSIRINIENILKSPNNIFFEIIKTLTKKNIFDCKKELEQKKNEIDTVLYDAINLVLSDLNNEVGYINRLLYRLFKFEIKKNIRREQLIILGSQLKSQHTILKKDIYRVKLLAESLYSTLKNLKRLQNAFQDKNRFIINQNMIKKSELYINKIEIKVLELEEYHDMLRDKLRVLQTNEKIISKLFKKIPRYYELREEIYLQLPL
jgi:hypothetical protein